MRLSTSSWPAGPSVGVTVIVIVTSPEDVPSAAGATASFVEDGTLLYIEGGPGGRVEAARAAGPIEPGNGPKYRSPPCPPTPRLGDVLVHLRRQRPPV